MNREELAKEHEEREPSREATKEDIEKRFKSFLAAPVGFGDSLYDKLKDAARAYEDLLAINRWQQWSIEGYIKEQRRLQPYLDQQVKEAVANGRKEVAEWLLQNSKTNLHDVGIGKTVKSFTIEISKHRMDSWLLGRSPKGGLK